MLDCVKGEKLPDKLCFADPAAPTFLILISFLAIKIAFPPPLQRIGNFAGKAANSLELIIQSPATLLHLISPACLPAPLWRRGTPFSIISSSDLPRCTPGCSSRLNPSSVNPAFHLAPGDLFSLWFTYDINQLHGYRHSLPHTYRWGLQASSCFLITTKARNTLREALTWKKKSGSGCSEEHGDISSGHICCASVSRRWELHWDCLPNDSTDSFFQIDRAAAGCVSWRHHRVEPAGIVYVHK